MRLRSRRYTVFTFERYRSLAAQESMSAPCARIRLQSGSGRHCSVRGERDGAEPLPLLASVSIALLRQLRGCWIFIRSDNKRLHVPTCAPDMNHRVAVGADDGQVVERCPPGLRSLSQGLQVMNVGIVATDLSVHGPKIKSAPWDFATESPPVFPQGGCNLRCPERTLTPPMENQPATNFTLESAHFVVEGR